MRIVDGPARTYVECVGSMGSAHAADAWHRVVSRHHDLYDAVRPWVPADEATERLPAIFEVHDTLPDALTRARSAVVEAADLLSQRTPVGRATTAVLMVGLGKANGWVARVDGRPTLVLAIEQLPPSPWDTVLALHELVHLVHMARAAADWPDMRMDADLFREGLAVHVTSELMPHVTPSGHLWFEPGRAAWVRDCEAVADQARSRARAILEGTESATEWFSAGSAPNDLPVRIGYWIGWKAVQELARGGRSGLDALLDRTLDDVRKDLAAALVGGRSADPSPCDRRRT